MTAIMILSKSIASKIRERRKQKKITLQDLADDIGVSRQAVGYWEVGKRSPRPDDLARIASALGVPVSYFYEDDPELQAERDKVTEVSRAREVLERFIASGEELPRLSAMLSQRLKNDSGPIIEAEISAKGPIRAASKSKHEVIDYLREHGILFHIDRQGNLVVEFPEEDGG